ncbi:hypothetical protein DFH07DRAFT_780011 [Mycena maculata]|uniref:Uncharacterized protein n=1 Tax=Mycena maculata TaxID=230809 RepID=A0AAD7MWK7_9AGAR|nr:hypothetical protein DFH07DRAFT_780011 [Mycena maculata]
MLSSPHLVPTRCGHTPTVSAGSSAATHTDLREVVYVRTGAGVVGICTTQAEESGVRQNTSSTASDESDELAERPYGTVQTLVEYSVDTVFKGTFPTTRERNSIFYPNYYFDHNPKTRRLALVVTSNEDSLSLFGCSVDSWIIKRRKHMEGDAEMHEPETKSSQIGRDALVDRVRGRLRREDIKRTMGAVAEEASHAIAAPMFETSIESVLHQSKTAGLPRVHLPAWPWVLLPLVFVKNIFRNPSGDPILEFTRFWLGYSSRKTQCERWASMMDPVACEAMSSMGGRTAAVLRNLLLSNMDFMDVP